MRNRIKVERAELDITQQQLAEAVGVSADNRCHREEPFPPFYSTCLEDKSVLP